MNSQAHRARVLQPAGFTLVELLVSMVILMILVGIVAVVFRGVTAISRSTSAAAETSQIARNTFDQIERDLAGLTRDGFLLIRGEGQRDPADFDGMQSAKINLSVTNEEGVPQKVTIGRTDWLAMVTTGTFTSQTDAVDATSGRPLGGLTSNAARVVYAHTNRVLGNQCATWATRPETWASNWTLVRQQTVLVPMLSSYDMNHDGVADYLGGDGSGSPGRSFLPTAGDVAEIALGDLLLYQRSATWDGGFNGHNSQNNAVTGLMTDKDFSPQKPEVAILRVKRPDLLSEQITNQNPLDVNPEAPASVSSLASRAEYYSIKQLTTPAIAYCEGYQRPRILAGKGADGLPGTADDQPSQMYGSIIAPRCPHFRVEYTNGDVNERGELLWLDELYWNSQYEKDMAPLIADASGWTVAFGGSSPGTARQEGLKGLPIQNDKSKCADNGRWPVAVRIQMVLVDSLGRDLTGQMFTRTMRVGR